jgi:hypothetical protein
MCVFFPTSSSAPMKIKFQQWTYGILYTYKGMTKPCKSMGVNVKDLPKRSFALLGDLRNVRSDNIFQRADSRLGIG